MKKTMLKPLFAAICLALSANNLFAESPASSPRESDVDFRLTLAWVDAASVNAHAGAPFAHIAPLVCHGMLFTGDAMPLLGGTFSLGAQVMGALETNADTGGQDQYAIATGGILAAMRWRFLDWLDFYARMGVPCGLSFLGTSGAGTSGAQYVGGYLGFEPAVGLAANLGGFRLSADFCYAFAMPWENAWLHPAGPRAGFGVGFRY